MPPGFQNTSDSEYLDDFRALSQHGRTAGGGVDRQAGTSADRAARAWLRDWLIGHGLVEATDAIGNQFGLAELMPGSSWILLGSHLDSQPLAGRYDGAYGVLAAAHAVARTAAACAGGAIRPSANLAVVNWFNEEGSRFAPSMMGSGVFTGKLALEAALDTADVAGTRVADVLPPPGEVRAPGARDVAAYGEIHIEQGRSLEASGTTIGLVNATWAARKYRARVLGEQSHTGATLMRDRRDALYGAALLIAAGRDLADEFADAGLHSGVSELYVLPNSPVTVAREVRMNLDLRCADATALDGAVASLERRVATVEKRSQTSVELRLTHAWNLMPYQPEGVELARRSAERLGISHATTMTVAGHDSTNLKDLVPTVMLFVPSAGGVSHNEAEFTNDQDALAGLSLFTDIAARLVAGELFPPA
ncbi:MAG: M20 family metallo-hydrolase [Bifidobacteriaceae bacterium]|jgi:N-carbamoyl-L-amino-acid hydrolase|nr:M20 family metallo-hydrolase [Bifidobacteriaceae bacterium]